MSKRGKEKNRAADAQKLAAEMMRGVWAQLRFAARLEGAAEEKDLLTAGKYWRSCHCPEACDEFYPLDWTRELVSIVQVVLRDGNMAWLETLTQVVYLEDTNQTIMVPDSARLDEESGVGALNISSCTSIHAAARLWRRESMDVFANLVIDACAGAVALLTHTDLPEPLATIRRELDAKAATAPSTVERLLSVLRKQRHEGERRGETEPLERWIAELEASAAMSNNVIVGVHGAFPADAVREAIWRFENRG